jgi:hypothetical protein
MIHEFALDPGVLASWGAFRYFVDQFGVAHGRLISRFPREWKRLVYEACTGCLPVERKRIEESLRSIDKKLISTGRDYLRSRPWINNAIQSHAERPFRAILTTASHAAGSDILNAEEVTSETPRWKVDRGFPVARQALPMADAAAALLRCSSEIVFVDQHFYCAAKHGRPLAQFLTHACSGSPLRRLEYHLNADGAADWFREELDKQRRFLNLPPGIRMGFFRWKTVDGGDNMHPRYILTEIGGVRFDYGLDEGADGETTDVELLSDNVYSARWAQFLPDSTAFDLVDAWIVTSATVARVGSD